MIGYRDPVEPINVRERSPTNTLIELCGKHFLTHEDGMVEEVWKLSEKMREEVPKVMKKEEQLPRRPRKRLRRKSEMLQKLRLREKQIV